MKVQLSVCAKDLPSAANVYATVSLDSIEVGKTDVEENSADPCWNKMVVFDYEEGSLGKLSIEICKEVDKSQVGKATFEVATILRKGMAKSISNCGIIAAYIEEYVPSELVDLDHVADKARVEMEAAVMVQDVKQTAEEKKKAMKIAQEEVVAAKALVEEKIKAAQVAAEETLEASKKSEELKEVADKVAERAKTTGCSGTFRLKLRAQDLPDTDGFFSLTDASFELFGARGEIVYCSEVVSNNLNPEWAVAEVDVGDLTGGKLNLPVRGEIHDYDKDKKGKYIGKFQMSVNEYLRAKHEDAIPIMKGGQEAQGSIFVELAELVDYKDLGEESKLLRKEAEESRLLFCQSRNESSAAQHEARCAKLAVIAAEEKVEAAKAAAESAWEAVKSAEDEAEALKKKFEEAAANRPKTPQIHSEIKPERGYRFGDITRGIVARGKRRAGREGEGYRFGDFTRGLIG